MDREIELEKSFLTIMSHALKEAIMKTNPLWSHRGLQYLTECSLRMFHLLKAQPVFGSFLKQAKNFKLQQF